MSRLTITPLSAALRGRGAKVTNGSIWYSELAKLLCGNHKRDWSVAFSGSYKVGPACPLCPGWSCNDGVGGAVRIFDTSEVKFLTGEAQPPPPHHLSTEHYKCLKYLGAYEWVMEWTCVRLTPKPTSGAEAQLMRTRASATWRERCSAAERSAAPQPPASAAHARPRNSPITQWRMSRCCEILFLKCTCLNSL